MCFTWNRRVLTGSNFKYNSGFKKLLLFPFSLKPPKNCLCGVTSQKLVLIEEKIWRVILKEMSLWAGVFLLIGFPLIPYYL